tara:strand:- start:1283 stop:1573 length:291 start_codon:yes stop_codon:yes gene_type:complete
MKQYNLYQRLKTEYTSELNRVAVKFPDIVLACKKFLHKNYDIQKLTLEEMQTFLVTISNVTDRHDLRYMDIIYGDIFFLTKEETKERNDKILKDFK